MNKRPFHHEGMRDLQDRLDEHRRHDEFWEERDWISVDCSVKRGDPGFVRIAA